MCEIVHGPLTLELCRADKQHVAPRQPERLDDAFRLTAHKGPRALSAVCEVWTHPIGWELRLVVEGHGLQVSSIVRTRTEMLERVEKWRAAMRAKGWS